MTESTNNKFGENLEKPWFGIDFEYKRSKVTVAQLESVRAPSVPSAVRTHYRHSLDGAAIYIVGDQSAL